MFSFCKPIISRNFFLNACGFKHLWYLRTQKGMHQRRFGRKEKILFNVYDSLFATLSCFIESLCSQITFSIRINLHQVICSVLCFFEEVEHIPIATFSLLEENNLIRAWNHICKTSDVFNVKRSVINIALLSISGIAEILFKWASSKRLCDVTSNVCPLLRI